MIAWTRTPGRDGYWWYRDLFFELVPPPGRATLELGCGEGRVCRDLASRGHRVTGLDSSPTLLAAARDAHADGEYVLADAAATPFADASFDLVVAHNSLMDIEDMPGAVREASRLLEPGGRFIGGSYFGRRRYERRNRARAARRACAAHPDRARERSSAIQAAARIPSQTGVRIT